MIKLRCLIVIFLNRTDANRGSVIVPLNFGCVSSRIAGEQGVQVCGDDVLLILLKNYNFDILTRVNLKRI